MSEESTNAESAVPSRDPVAAAPVPGYRKKRSSTRGRLLRTAGTIAAAAAFLFAVSLSMRLGIAMAKKRTPDTVAAPEADRAMEFAIGRIVDPVYLAETADEIRRFFGETSGPGDRASRDLSDRAIRRITSPVQMRVRKIEADAVEVEILSGSISGAVYWLHHSQIPDPSALDPIISPLPAAGE